ncbi:hypothetical protein [Streptomyces sp. HD]|uniref:hypothetical protein n=1 Tax=Streptomyces sp. HD TaxID=3020892 RepID=UPI0023305C89|nr:hypothetical protein [Streptomyces sp. HD]MDC0769605.1 hypothetical protein [Streptomyces sp. HD]
MRSGPGPRLPRRGPGQPLIDEPVRRIIVERSHGLPLYLDLSVMRHLELRRNGGQSGVGSRAANQVSKLRSMTAAIRSSLPLKRGVA